MVSAAVSSGCRDATGSAPPRTYVVREESSAVGGLATIGDSVFFTTTRTALLRARALTGPWEPVARLEDRALGIFPLADGSLLLTMNDCLQRWHPDSGVTIELWSGGPTVPPLQCPSPVEIEQLPNREVYASWFSTMLKREPDGTWSVMPREDIQQGWIYGLASIGDTLWAAADGGILRRAPGGRWEAYGADTVLTRDQCEAVALAESKGAMYGAYGRCVSALYPGTPRRVTTRPSGMALYRGGSSTGAALFWEYTGDVIVVRDGTARRVDTGGLRIISQALLVRDTVVVAGHTETDGVIQIIPLSH